MPLTFAFGYILDRKDQQERTVGRVEIPLTVSPLRTSTLFGALLPLGTEWKESGISFLELYVDVSTPYGATTRATALLKIPGKESGTTALPAVADQTQEFPSRREALQPAEETKKVKGPLEVKSSDIFVTRTSSSSLSHFGTHPWMNSTKISNHTVASNPDGHPRLSNHFDSHFGYGLPFIGNSSESFEPGSTWNVSNYTTSSSNWYHQPRTSKTTPSVFKHWKPPSFGMKAQDTPSFNVDQSWNSVGPSLHFGSRANKKTAHAPRRLLSVSVESALRVAALRDAETAQQGLLAIGIQLLSACRAASTPEKNNSHEAGTIYKIAWLNHSSEEAHPVHYFAARI
eukprot:GHVT01027746.1.p1 GENE.GHVT01027746.1~~GHVT01027746.1.p1  ORF type:complete len:343 (-),score=26.49 GHVT01027746.1:357-1385(-)